MHSICAWVAKTETIARGESPLDTAKRVYRNCCSVLVWVCFFVCTCIRNRKRYVRLEGEWEKERDRRGERTRKREREKRQREIEIRRFKD